MKRYMMGLLLAGAVFTVGQAQAFTIDDYNFTNDHFPCPPAFDNIVNGQCVRVNSADKGPNTQVDTGLPLASTVGGSRSLSIVAKATIAGGNTTATAGVNLSEMVDGSAGDGEFSYANGPNVTSTVTTVYDANGLGFDVDLTDGGLSDRLLWDVQSLDINLLVTVKFEDTDGTMAGNSFLKLPVGQLGNPPCTVSPLVCVQPDGSLLHLLSLFNGPSVIDPARPGVSFYDDPTNMINDTLLAPTGGTTAGLDLTHIRKITFVYDTTGNLGDNALDLTEDLVGTVGAVPEPGTILLLGTGLLGVGLSGAASRLRRRQRQA